MICRICGQDAEDELCETCFQFYKWKYKVKTNEEVLEIQDRRQKNVGKTVRKTKKK
jgi:hypothetical protein